MHDIFSRVAELKNQNRPFALATIVYSEDSTPRKVGTRMIVYPDGKIEGTIGGGALEKRVINDALRLCADGKSQRFVYDLEKGRGKRSVGMICGGKVEVLIESFGNRTKIFIFGAGHIGKKIAEICSVLGIAYWIVDNRGSYAKEELFPDAMGVFHSEFDKSFSLLPIDENSFLIIVTYGHEYDGVCLEAALKTTACYIGMIGSKRKVKKLFESLSKKGVKVNDPRVYAPIGLELGNNTPEEISISILSEILKIESKGSGRHLREWL